MYAIQLYNFNLMKYAIQLYNFNLMKSINSQITKNCGIFLLTLLHLLWWWKNLCCRSRNLENYHNEGFEWSFPTFRSQIFFLPGIRTFWNTTLRPGKSNDSYSSSNTINYQLIKHTLLSFHFIKRQIFNSLRTFKLMPHGGNDL